jgi:organic hydroperoxide reductase OsmC/OhrA
MSEHKIALSWNRTSPDFAYKSYNREHKIAFKNGVQVDVSAAPAFLGKAEFIDPEEMFVAAYASCHMLTFLAIAAKKNLIVDSYEDHAVGHLRKNDEGKLAITHIELFPVVVFSGSKLGSDELARMHELSHQECFIANSSKVTGTVHPQSL